LARYGADAVVSLHSGMTHPQRLKSWLAAHAGAARIVLGTRMAVFASMPGLGLIVVDEEHDPSYKQQEGARYSARDLAVYRGKLEGAKVLLGSATPSLESWQACDDPGGRYQRLAMPSRIGAGRLPKGAAGGHEPAAQKPCSRCSCWTPSASAGARRTVAGVPEPARLRPGAACAACDWKSECPHCSAYRVFHKIDRTLRCHHCGFTERVPRACPACGNVDIAPLGRGTERLEEHLAELLADTRNAHGTPVRIAHGRRHHAAQGRAGKPAGAGARGRGGRAGGHADDCQGPRLSPHHAGGGGEPGLGAVLQRLPRTERLFSLLMQAAGRAGRDAAQARRQRDVDPDLAPGAPAV
jgi:primosomal protein N' (replication factor Y)